MDQITLSSDSSESIGELTSGTASEPPVSLPAGKDQFIETGKGSVKVFVHIADLESNSETNRTNAVNSLRTYAQLVIL